MLALLILMLVCYRLIFGLAEIAKHLNRHRPSH